MRPTCSIRRSPAPGGTGSGNPPGSTTWGARRIGSGVNTQWARGSYRAVSGRSDGEGWWDSIQVLESDLPMAWRGAMHSVGGPGLTTERVEDVADGTSNTMLVGEMASFADSVDASNRSPERRRTFWAYTYTSYNQSTATPQSRTFLVDYGKCVDVGGRGGSNPCKRGWGSYHPSGINFVFCDGSTRFVQPTVDILLFVTQASIEGGQTELLELQGAFSN